MEATGSWFHLVGDWAILWEELGTRIQKTTCSLDGTTQQLAFCGPLLLSLQMKQVDLGANDQPQSLCFQSSSSDQQSPTFHSAKMLFLGTPDSPRPPRVEQAPRSGSSLPANRVCQGAGESGIIRGRTWELLPFICKGKSRAGVFLLTTPASEPTSLVICKP